LSARHDIKKMTGYRYSDSADSRALMADGKVLKQGKIDEKTVELRKWNNIVDITNDHGLKADGTVVTTVDYSNERAQGVSEWKNIIHIINCFGCVGVSSAGQVYVAHNEPNFANEAMLLALYHTVGNWHNLIDVKEFYYESHFRRERGAIGLLANGQLVTSNVPYDLSGWNNIISFYCAKDVIVGVCADGRVLVAGKDPYQLKDEIENWRLFDHINTYDRERLSMVQKVFDKLTEDITAKESELNNIRGWFTGKKKRELGNELEKLKEKISVVQYHINTLQETTK